MVSVPVGIYSIVRGSGSNDRCCAAGAVPVGLRHMMEYPFRRLLH
jgi:hypothetical protein